MQEREHTTVELEKLNCCKAYLKANGVFDKDSFVELTSEYTKISPFRVGGKEGTIVENK